jgi:hypothetical protein
MKAESSKLKKIADRLNSEQKMANQREADMRKADNKSQKVTYAMCSETTNHDIYACNR